jgi:type III pantothenate kinase
MVEMSRDYLSVEPIVITSDLDFGISILTDNPREVGADRLVNALAAYRTYDDNCLIIDFGTATTFDLVSDRGEYLGGAIAPGVETASANLANKAAQLFSVEIGPPKNVIGKTTEESMKSGIFWGQVEMINGMIVRIEDEFERECKIVMTGGYGKSFGDYIDRESVYNRDLTLEGLRLAYETLA